MSSFETSFVTIAVEHKSPPFALNYFCETTAQLAGQIDVLCNTAPANGAYLNYVVVNLPAHVP